MSWNQSEFKSLLLNSLQFTINDNIDYKLINKLSALFLLEENDTIVIKSVLNLVNEIVKKWSHLVITTQMEFFFCFLLVLFFKIIFYRL